MAGKKQAPRQERERRPFSRPMRYDQRTVREERGIRRILVRVAVARSAPGDGVFLRRPHRHRSCDHGLEQRLRGFPHARGPREHPDRALHHRIGRFHFEIGENLEKAQLLRNRTVFRYLVQFLGVTDKISYGTFDLSPSMDVNAIIDELSSGSQNAERTITIIPGWTVEDIADYLYAEGAIQSREEFLNLCRDAAPFAEMSYPIKLAQDMGTLSGRKYQLEGYLAPDTYRVFRNASAQQIVNTLVEQTNTVIDEVYYADTIQYEVDPRPANTAKWCATATTT